jgi:hypothetical protein
LLHFAAMLTLLKAPTVPKKRPSIREKASQAGPNIYAPPARREGAVIDDGFISSKKDKRLIKHSAFVNRIEKAQQKPLKRRRPSKKLITSLESLVDALPNAGDAEKEVGDAKIKQRSIKIRPGAMKRKGKMEKLEKERFMKNMAQLSVGISDSMGEEEQKVAMSNRWATLRGFISQTLEQKEEFQK